MTCATTLMVDWMPGGPLGDFLALVRTLDCAEIRGLCGSGCTILFGLDNVCVHDSARLLFHGPDVDNSTRQLEISEHMSRNWPDRLREWFLSGPWELRGQDNFVELSGVEVQAMGVDRC